MDVEAEVTIVREFVAKGNFHAAMNIAISALNECRNQNNQQGVDRFILIIHEIVGTMAETFGSRMPD